MIKKILLEINDFGWILNVIKRIEEGWELVEH
jgi:hypothetical protein